MRSINIHSLQFSNTENCNYLLTFSGSFCIIFLYLCTSTGVCLKAEGGKHAMAEIRIKENETLDSALRRFKRQCAKSGVLSEIRKREHYEKPSVKRKKKSEAARKRKY